MGFISIKKKIRGLKKKAKRIDNWKNDNINLDVDILNKYGKEYVKIWISPFCNLHTINSKKCGKKNPPNWFNRLILEAMIEIYYNWDKKLKELNSPYYLKIWLYDPNFIKSQIVAAIGESIEGYNNLFSQDSNKLIFPKEKLRVNNYDIMEFNWELCKDEIVVFESEYLNDVSYLEYVKGKAYKIQKEKILGKEETCIYVREGNVWVGSRGLVKS